jgi:DNA sulfur modification protein DndE
MLAHNDLTLRSLGNINFRPTANADKANDKLRVKLGLETRYEPARLAIAFSLSHKKPFVKNEDNNDEELGKPINGRILFGDELLPVWLAMIIEDMDENAITIEAIQRNVKNHWSRGIFDLIQIWENLGEDYNKFILYLAEKSGLPDVLIDNSPVINDSLDFFDGALQLKLGEIGTDLQNGKVIKWHLNGNGSPHAAFMGATGSGKSRLALNMIAQIRKNSNASIILFDFAKGDIANNDVLIKHIGATVINCPEKPVPLDVLNINSPTANNITNAAMRFRESFIKLPKSKPGAVQMDDLRDAAKNVFLKNFQKVKIDDIFYELQNIYNQSGKDGDIITSTFKDLMQWKLFDPVLSPADFFGKSWVIDIHEASETAQRLIVFLILDSLYSYVKSLPDSKLDTQNNRALKLVLVIDEARRVLKYGQESLINLIRESRSKGIAIFLISQSPEDFDTNTDNFLEQIGFTACFKSNGRSSKVLKACLGQNIDLAGLPDGVAVTRMTGEEGIRKIKVW